MERKWCPTEAACHARLSRNETELQNTQYRLDLERLGRQHLEVVHERAQRQVHDLNWSNERLARQLQHLQEAYEAMTASQWSTEVGLQKEVQLRQQSVSSSIRDSKNREQTEQLNASLLDGLKLIVRVLHLRMDSGLSEERKSELSIDVPDIVLEREILRNECTRLNRELGALKAQSDEVTDIEDMD